MACIIIHKTYQAIKKFIEDFDYARIKNKLHERAHRAKKAITYAFGKTRDGFLLAGGKIKNALTKIGSIFNRRKQKQLDEELGDTSSDQTDTTRSSDNDSELDSSQITTTTSQRESFELSNQSQTNSCEEPSTPPPIYSSSVPEGHLSLIQSQQSE